MEVRGEETLYPYLHLIIARGGAISEFELSPGGEGREVVWLEGEVCLSIYLCLCLYTHLHLIIARRGAISEFEVSPGGEGREVVLCEGEGRHGHVGGGEEGDEGTRGGRGGGGPVEKGEGRVRAGKGRRGGRGVRERRR